MAREKVIRVPAEEKEFKQECDEIINKAQNSPTKMYEDRMMLIDGVEREVKVNSNGDVVYRDRFGNVKRFRKERLDAGEVITDEYQSAYDLRISANDDGTITAKVELGTSEKFVEKLLPYTSEKLRDKILTDGADMFKSMEEQIGEKAPEGYKEIQAAQDRARKERAERNLLKNGANQQGIIQASVKNETKCSGCDRVVQPDSNFCSFCGTKI